MKPILLIILFFHLAARVYSQSLDSIDLKEKGNWTIFNDQSNVMEYSKNTGGVHDIWAENDSNYWVATGGHTYQVINDHWIKQEFDSPLNDSIGFNVTQLFYSPFSSTLWFGSNYYGITSFKDSIWQKRIESPLTNSSHIDLILEDKKKNLLINGCRNVNEYSDCFSLIQTGNNELIHYREKLKPGNYTTPTVDPEGNFVIITSCSKFTFKNGKWKESELPKGLDMEQLNYGEVVFAENESIWILCKYNYPKTVKLFELKRNAIIEHLVPPDLNADGGIRKMLTDSKGRLWFCVAATGYIVFDENHWTKINSSNSPIEGKSYNTLFMKDETIWFGTDQGVFMYRTDNFE